MRVRVDPDLCQGHTLCALAAPDIFLFDDEDGHAFVARGEVPPGREDAVARAASTCPEGAIVVSD